VTLPGDFYQLPPIVKRELQMDRPLAVPQTVEDLKTEAMSIALKEPKFHDLHGRVRVQTSGRY
jgi:hypothetical protein